MLATAYQKTVALSATVPNGAFPAAAANSARKAPLCENMPLLNDASINVRTVTLVLRPLLHGRSSASEPDHNIDDVCMLKVRAVAPHQLPSSAELPRRSRNHTSPP